MNHLPETLLVVYLVLGVLLATIGPAGEDIQREMERTRGTPMLNAYLERDPPPEWKLFIFRAMITTGFILLWPIFIVGIVKAQREGREEAQSFEDERSQGLWFHYLGGCGTLTCQDCSHRASVTSFTHGRDSSTSGYQCQACGKFHAISTGGPGRASQTRESLVCDCGGKLRRDKVLFCPHCQSRKLSYFLEFIT